MADKKVALITGANKGIGKEIARQLGMQGFTVLIGARDAGRGAQAAEDLKTGGVDAHAIVLDVTNPESLSLAAAKVAAEYGKLDVLVNNAGIYIEAGSASQTDLETFKKTYDTNVFGVFASTQAFLPLVKKAEAGRIVNMSSGLGSITFNSDPDSPFAAFKAVAYNSSKSAVNAITVIFAAELKDTPIKVNAADPGYVATDINGNSGPRTVTQGATAAVHLATLPADGPTGGYFNEDGPLPW